MSPAHHIEMTSVIRVRTYENRNLSTVSEAVVPQAIRPQSLIKREVKKRFLSRKPFT
jgi:hypothetical protein